LSKRVHSVCECDPFAGKLYGSSGGQGACIFGSPDRIFDVGGLVAIAGMALMLIVSAISNTVKLYRAETLR
jgi:hypothetical protein